MEKLTANGKSIAIWVWVLGFVFFLSASPSHAQKSPQTLALVYSNNINGEIDPCPT